MRGEPGAVTVPNPGNMGGTVRTPLPLEQQTLAQQTIPILRKPRSYVLIIQQPFEPREPGSFAWEAGLCRRVQM